MGKITDADVVTMDSMLISGEIIMHPCHAKNAVAKNIILVIFLGGR